MACCYCSRGQPLIRGANQHGYVELTFIDKQNQFCYYEEHGTKNSTLIAFPINFCPYCGQKLYKEKENVSVYEQWWDNNHESD